MKKIFVVYGHYNEKSFNAAIRDIFIKTVKNLGHEIDIVDLYKENFNPVFSGEEPDEKVLDIAHDTVNIKAKVLWLQLGIKNEQAKKLVIKNKIEYIEDRCTKMEYQKHFLKIRQAFPVLQD